MTKHEFERELIANLKGLSREEQQKTLDYYNEVFCDRREVGESEEDIIRSFGSPEEVAARILSEPSFFAKTTRKIKGKISSIFTNKSFLIFYFSAFVITFPITIALFSVAFGLGIAAISIIAAFYICAFALIIAGPAYMIFGPISAGGFNAAGFAVFGCGLACIALGILFLSSLKIFNRLRILIFVPRENKPKTQEGGKKSFKVLLAVACIMVVAGGSLFTVGFGMANWNIRKLDTAEYQPKTYVINESAIRKITLDIDARDVEIIAATENFRVETNDYAESRLSIDMTGDNLVISEKYTFDFFQLFNLFSGVNYKLQRIKIYVPANLDEVDVSLTSGYLEINGMNIGTVDAKVTSGDIVVKNCSVTKIKVHATSGNINTYSLVTSEVDMKATSGNIHARIVGAFGDYDIKSHVTSGDNHVGSRGDYDNSIGKKIYIRATSGNIRLTFVQA